jgi:hypothetical protein
MLFLLIILGVCYKLDIFISFKKKNAYFGFYWSKLAAAEEEKPLRKGLSQNNCRVRCSKNYLNTYPWEKDASS